LRLKHTVKLWGFCRQYPRWLFPGRTDRDPSERALRTEGEATLDPLVPWSWSRTARKVVTAASDLLIVHWWVTYWAFPFAFVAARARSGGVPVLYFCHNVLPHEEKPWDRPLTRLALSQGDAHMTTSRAQSGQLLDLLPGATVYSGFLPSCSALAELGPTFSRKEACRRLSLDASRPVALFFGFVRPYKGLHDLVEALPAVLQRVGLQLLVVGEFWHDKQAYLDQIAQLGVEDAVTIVDRYVPNEDLGLYFGAADVAVLPYRSVTQSAVVQLAYGFGKPVIATRVGDLPEVVLHERTGLIVPPSDPGALAAGLVRYFEEDMAAKMGDEVLLGRERFSWRRVDEVVEQVAHSAPRTA
jgi:glycosyltransferase involved in cell wall biosynthesis